MRPRISITGCVRPSVRWFVKIAVKCRTRSHLGPCIWSCGNRYLNARYLTFFHRARLSLLGFARASREPLLEYAVSDFFSPRASYAPWLRTCLNFPSTPNLDTSFSRLLTLFYVASLSSYFSICCLPVHARY